MDPDTYRTEIEHYDEETGVRAACRAAYNPFLASFPYLESFHWSGPVTITKEHYDAAVEGMAAKVDAWVDSVTAERQRTGRITLREKYVPRKPLWHDGKLRMLKTAKAA